MIQLINWLSRNKWVNIGLLIAYFIIVVAPHKRFGTFINTVIFKGMPRDESNMIMLGIALLTLSVYGYYFGKYAKKRDDHQKLWIFLIVDLLLAYFVVSFLFVNNVEVVHFPQYALFSILLFPLIGNYTATMVWATLAGALDEAYQYFYLAPKDTSYYDMNDVVTNLVGVVLGLLLLRAFGIAEKSVFNIRSSTIWIGIALVVAAILIAHLSGILSIYPDDSRPFQILREWPPGFWSHVHPNITYHVIRPIEGLVITILLWIVFSHIRPKQTLL